MQIKLPNNKNANGPNAGGANKAALAQAAERRPDALRLRQSGRSYRQIAAELGVSVSVAYRDVTAELARLAQECHEEAAALRVLELERLDDALRRVCRIMNDDKAEADIVLRSVDRLVRISESRRRLLGLDEPQRQELSGPHGGAVRIAAEPAGYIEDMIYQRHPELHEAAQKLALQMAHAIEEAGDAQPVERGVDAWQRKHAGIGNSARVSPTEDPECSAARDMFNGLITDRVNAQKTEQP